MDVSYAAESLYANQLYMTGTIQSDTTKVIVYQIAGRHCSSSKITYQVPASSTPLIKQQHSLLPVWFLLTVFPANKKAISPSNKP